MKKRKRNLGQSIGRIIAATFWILMIVGLVLLNVYYDSDKQYSGDFFEDVAKTMQW